MCTRSPPILWLINGMSTVHKEVWFRFWGYLLASSHWKLQESEPAMVKEIKKEWKVRLFKQKLCPPCWVWCYHDGISFRITSCFSIASFILTGCPTSSCKRLWFPHNAWRLLIQRRCDFQNFDDLIYFCPTSNLHISLTITNSELVLILKGIYVGRGSVFCAEVNLS